MILFKYDEGVRRWKRVLEGLCLGIQPEVSNILDLHTIGFAADVSRQSDAEVQRAFAAIGAGHGMVAVQYKHFIHFHESGRETYFIDKREFPSFAKALMAETMSSYPDDSCILFDMPRIADLSLSHDFGRFRLVGETLNDQRWTVTFIGIGGGGYLDQKHISVKSIATID